jgi:DNA-binding response OmpR family regulator
MTTAATVLLVEDDPDALRLASFFLKRAGYEVLTASDGVSGLDLARKANPALVILDWQLPGLTGIDVCRKLRKDSQVPILMLTSMDTVADRVEGLETGADDYLVKPYAPEELIARVAARLRVRPAVPVAASELEVGDLHLSLDTHTASRAGRPLALSPKEFELLHFFMKHPNKVLRRNQLLAEVWGDPDAYDANVLDVYIGYLRQKLEEGDLPRVLQTKRGVGFFLEAAEHAADATHA